MEHLLANKVIIITGASSGIGAATARALVGLGCRVTLAARSGDRLHALAAELGPGALALPTDVTVEPDVQRMVAATLERYGRADVLFANAGLYIPGQVAEGDPAAWARLIVSQRPSLVCRSTRRSRWQRRQTSCCPASQMVLQTATSSKPLSIAWIILALRLCVALMTE